MAHRPQQPKQKQPQGAREPIDIWHSPLPASLTGQVADTSAASSSTSFAEPWVTSVVAAGYDAKQAYASKVEGRFLQLDTTEPRKRGQAAAIRSANTGGGGSGDTHALTATEVAEETRRARRKRVHARHETRFSRKDRRRMGLFDIPESDRRFDVFVPLHILWTQYVAELLGIQLPQQQQQQQQQQSDDTHKSDKNTQDQQPYSTPAMHNIYKSIERSTALKNQPTATLGAKLVRADVHGALITVIRSTCPTNVGITGIIVKDTEHMFYIITRANRMKAIPKLGHVFTFAIGQTVVTVYGNQFCVRPAERASKKFKAKPTVDF